MKPCETAIDVSCVFKSYGNIKALDNISLNVEQGELFGLIGPDGAGKSSLYRILTTLTAPDSGKASVLGYDTVRDYRAIRRSIGYMPEQFSLYPDLTVKENLEFFASLFGVSVKENYNLIAPVFGQLERFLDRKAGALSGGMKQKLALSCALIHRPRLLLLDEPTTGVDAVSRNEFWDRLHILHEQGMTIMVSTSYMDEASRCGRIAMIDKGRILCVDTPGNLIAGLGENLWSAEAADMYRLLDAMRTLPEVKECYTFGATLHMVTTPGFDAAVTLKILASLGLADARIFPAQGTVEDMFIKLMNNE